MATNIFHEVEDAIKMTKQLKEDADADGSGAGGASAFGAEAAFLDAPPPGVSGWKKTKKASFVMKGADAFALEGAKKKKHGGAGGQMLMMGGFNFIGVDDDGMVHDAVTERQQLTRTASKKRGLGGGLNEVYKPRLFERDASEPRHLTHLCSRRYNSTAQLAKAAADLKKDPSLRKELEDSINAMEVIDKIKDGQLPPRSGSPSASSSGRGRTAKIAPANGSDRPNQRRLWDEDGESAAGSMRLGGGSEKGTPLATPATSTRTNGEMAPPPFISSVDAMASPIASHRVMSSSNVAGRRQSSIRQAPVLAPIRSRPSALPGP